MIEKIHIRNFQKFQTFSLEPGPCVTTLVGPSDTGKSACLRALRWVCLNRPNGDAFRKHGSSLCTVTVHVDGHKIVRKKGQGENSYLFDDKEYTALGSGGVPSDMERLLLLDEENFQSQHAPPFWISLTAGELSRELNRIVDLDMIDRVLSFIQSRIRSESAQVVSLEKRVESLETEVRSLAWVDPALKELNRLEQLEIELNELEEKACMLEEMIETLHRQESLIEGREKSLEEAEKLLEIEARYLEKKRWYDSLESLIEDHQRACQRQKQLQEELTQSTERLKKLPPDPEEKLCRECGRPM